MTYEVMDEFENRYRIFVDNEIQWLQREARKFVKKYWNLESIPEILIDPPIDLNWERANAFYIPEIKACIFNSNNNAKHSRYHIKRWLLHELCHWYLHTTGQPYKDSDFSFAKELIRVGLGRQHNRDEESIRAIKEARKQMKTE